MNDTASNSPPKSLPCISILIAVRNESEHLEDCLSSIVGQDYPTELLEIIIVDGMSTDQTPDILRRWHSNDKRIQIIQNPLRSTAAGMNLAIRKATHEFCLWTSGHAILAPTHLSQSVEALEATGAAAVGGVLETKGTTTIGRINAAVLSHRFGVGNAPHRVAIRSDWSSTVTMALYRRSAILAAGGFNENLPRNQDNDLHDRMNRLGHRSYLDVRIRPTYLCRNTLSGLLRQAGKNGYWNVMMTRMGYGGLSLRHFIPMAFVGIQLLVLTLGFVFPSALVLLAVVAGLHLLFAAMVSLEIAINRGMWWEWLIMPVWFVLLHWSYGLSSWTALLARRPNKSGQVK